MLTPKGSRQLIVLLQDNSKAGFLLWKKKYVWNVVNQNH